MALLGGTKRMRGYYEGRYRDNNAVLLQTESRFTVWKRFGVVGFYNFGGIASTISTFKLNEFKHTGGMGLRWMIDPERKVNLRVDSGYSEDGLAFYVTFGEAF